MTRKIRSVSYPRYQLYTKAFPVDGVAHPSPHKLLIKGGFGLWRCDLGQQRRERFNEVEEAYCMRMLSVKYVGGINREHGGHTAAHDARGAAMRTL